MKNIAVFASGNGSNFQAIIDEINAGYLNANVSLLVCDKKDAYAIKRAENEGISVLYKNPRKYKTKEDYEEDILIELKKKEVEFIVLAGYMRIIGHTLLCKYDGKIVNIHPSLLPAFKGINAIEQALIYGVKIIGVTVHYIDSGVDTGKIISQEAFRLNENDTLKEIKKKIHDIEHKLYPNTLKKLFEKQEDL